MLNRLQSAKFIKSISVTALAALISLTHAASIQTANAGQPQPPHVASAASNVLPNGFKIADTAFTQVLAGAYYSVGLRADGSVWTWGRNLLGELGIPDTTSVSSMNAPVRLSSMSGITSIATSGYGYQLALKKDGTVWEWGESFGNSTQTQPPRQLTSLSGISRVYTLHYVSFALKPDGTVWTWMRNAETGESGKAQQINGLHKITDLVTAESIVYALDTSGAVWAFTAGQTDNGLNVSVPSQIRNLPAMKQISADAQYKIYGIDQTGTAWKGSIDPSSPSIKLVGKPAKIYPKLRIQNVKAANGYALLLTEQGEVWTYGKNPAGKEGIVKGIRQAVSISAGDTHSLAIDASGQVWGWGANTWNQVGVPRHTDDGMEYVPQRIQTPVTVVVNGKLMPASFPAVIKDNLVSVPLKSMVKELGASLEVTVSLDGHQKYSIRYKDTVASFDSKPFEVTVNGEKKMLFSPIYGVSGATMIPVTLLKYMGFSAAYDPKAAQLSISSP
ncbi:stalk domain-containing protein [Paenibacillus sp. SAF-054]|uniref:stalk domain-containing protein n=1 Tax=unclassified Paenibacillus TaxID=185978 RepID=UPI003F8135F0